MHYLGSMMYPPDVSTDDILSSWFDSGTDVATSSWELDDPNEGLHQRQPSADSDEPLQFSHTATQKQRTLAPNLTRRSHRKSRAGCFTCKGRKIKCGEEKPRCRHCVQKDLDCIFPDQHQQLTRQHIARRPPPPQPLSPTTGTFTLNDFRFFQHFLKYAYPTLPAGNDQVWVRDVPQLALENEYLMHAVLCLGASHLHRLCPESDYETRAIVHRGHALAGLNKAIARPQTVRHEADAMLATCYALTFQASYMDDGLQDFITMVRGCALVTGKIQDESAGTSFDLSPNLHFESLEPGLSQMSKLESDFIEPGIVALEAVKSLISPGPGEDFHTALVNVLFALRQSTRQGYVVFTQVYTCWILLAGDDFREFTDPQNLVSQILLAYFVAIQLIMAPVTAPMFKSAHRENAPGVEILLGIVAWGERIFPNVPDEAQNHVVWPRMVFATVRNEIANPRIEKRLLKLR